MGNKLDTLAVRVGFEPTEPVKVQRFSRPPDSTTLAPHRSFILPCAQCWPQEAPRALLRGGEPAEKAVRFPLGSLGRIGDPFEQRRKYAVELRGRGQVDRLAGIVGHAMIARAVPIPENLFLRTARNPAEFERERRHAFLDEAVLIAADKAIGIGLL